MDKVAKTKRDIASLLPRGREMEPATSAIILELYRGTREVPHSEFQRWALERMRTLIPFDSAMWGSGALEPNVIHNVHLYKQPRRMIDEYLARFYEQDFLRIQVSEHPGVTVNASDLENFKYFEDSEIYRDFARHYGIYWTLCTTIVEPASSLLNFLSLWRRKSKRPFTEEERMRKQLLMPHLHEAFRLSRFIYMRDKTRLTRPEWAMAVCDRQGILHQAEERFSALLRVEWAHWNTAKLPQKICAHFLEETSSSALVAKQIVIKSAPFEDLIFLQARKKTDIDRLGAKERLAATQLARGLTYEEIAQQLNVSPATVRNQLHSVYKKLGIGNRVALAKKMQTFDVD